MNLVQRCTAAKNLLLRTDLFLNGAFELEIATTFRYGLKY